MNLHPNTPFYYVACQHGAEPLLKQAFCGSEGPFRMAYSGRGFLTFKREMALPIWSRALPEHPMVRSRGVVLQKFEGTESQPLIERILGEYAGLDWDLLHVWQRDPSPIGWRGFEPGESVLALELAREIRQGLRKLGDLRPVVAHGLEPEAPPSDASVSPESGAAPGLRPEPHILEVVIDTPQRWWVTAKVARKNYDHWPGGVPELVRTTEPISRAYNKLAEAMAWSGFSLKRGEPVVEIGSAPGGACQWLLEAGAKVTGIDPAEMDPRVLEHPNFTHWRMRSLQVKRRMFRSFRLLVCDANVTPNYTLDTVEAIVTYPDSRFRGLILTMKLPDWEQAARIPEHLERVRSWGYEMVEARQLASNRREYCLVAKRRIRTPEKPSTDETPTPPSS